MKKLDKEKIKVAFFVGIFPVVSESWLIEQIIALTKKGIKIDIFSFTRGKDQEIIDFLRNKGWKGNLVYLDFPLPKLKRLTIAIPLFLKILFLKPRLLERVFSKKYGPDAWSLKYLFWVAPLVDKIEDYDFIHCHFGMIGNRFLIIKNILGLKKEFITSFYGLDGSQYIKQRGPQYYERLRQEGDYFLPNSENMRQDLIKIGFPPNRTITQYLGLNLDYYPFEVKEFRVGEILHIIFVGRFVEKKGIKDLLLAVAQVFAKYKKIKLHIVGGGEKEYEEKIKASISQLGIEPIVKFYGFKPHAEVITMFSQMHLIVQLSKTSSSGDTEGLPYVLCEAQACGLPVVSTRHAGIPEAVQEGLTGFLVAEGDCRQAAEKILFFINNPRKIKEFSLHSREFISQKFGMDKTVNQLIKIYKNLADGYEKNNN